MRNGTKEELDVLCRNRFVARSLASSNASVAVSGLFVHVDEFDVASDTLELLVSESSAFVYSRFLVAMAVGVLVVCDASLCMLTVLL